MPIRLSDHFSYRRLIRFTLPSIVMMIFTSIYGVVDGLFVSNFVGKTPFAAVNFIMPFLMILGTIGFMFGTGGSALISKTMGEGDCEKANRLFFLFVYVSFIFSVIIAICCCRADGCCCYLYFSFGFAKKISLLGKHLLFNENGRCFYCFLH
jgi:Na+-driven multidrug efflux pump